MLSECSVLTRVRLCRRRVLVGGAVRLRGGGEGSPLAISTIGVAENRWQLRLSEIEKLSVVWFLVRTMVPVVEANILDDFDSGE